MNDAGQIEFKSPLSHHPLAVAVCAHLRNLAGMVLLSQRLLHTDDVPSLRAVGIVK